jgi:tyrosine phenol-lyase
MSNRSLNSTFSVPFEIAVARPLRPTTPSEREEALQSAHYNTELLPQDLIYVDLSTDSGVSSMSTHQIAQLLGAKSLEPGMGLAVDGSRAFASLAERIHEFLGFPYVIATTQGRSAERIWTKIYVKPETVVAGNMLFPSTRAHIEMNGARVIDVIGDGAHDLTSNEPFKGNIDVKKLQAAVQEIGADKMSCIYVELSVNACGGHPVSLANIKQVKAVAAAHQIPFFLDACRILENSYFIKQREAEYRDHSIREIVKETCASADACTLSALKDWLVSCGGLILTRDKASYQKAVMQSFLDGVQLPGSAMELLAASLYDVFKTESYVKHRVEQVQYLWRRLDGRVPVVKPQSGHAVYIDLKAFLPHLGAEQFPAEAFAAFVYQTAGVRITKGPPLAPSQTARGIELVRLAIPARKYLQGHLDDVAEAVLHAYANRKEIRGLKRVGDGARSKYEPTHFMQL